MNFHNIPIDDAFTCLPFLYWIQKNAQNSFQATLYRCISLLYDETSVQDDHFLSETHSKYLHDFLQRSQQNLWFQSHVDCQQLC